MPNPNWVLKCLTVQDWKTFPDELADTQHKDQTRLYHYLVDKVAPLAIQAIQVP